MNKIDLLTHRVSYPKLHLPAPSTEQLVELFRAADRAPDHKQLKPWRFKVVNNAQLDAFGELMLTYQLGLDPELDESTVQRTVQKAHRAPMIIIAMAAYQEHPKVPKVEQTLAVGAAVQNLMLAADAIGFGAMWRTGDFAFSQVLREALKLRDNEEVCGIIYVGTPPEHRKKLRGANLDEFVQYWRP